MSVLDWNDDEISVRSERIEFNQKVKEDPQYRQMFIKCFDPILMQDGTLALADKFNGRTCNELFGNDPQPMIDMVKNGVVAGIKTPGELVIRNFGDITKDTFPTKIECQKLIIYNANRIEDLDIKINDAMTTIVDFNGYKTDIKNCKVEFLRGKCNRLCISIRDAELKSFEGVKSNARELRCYIPTELPEELMQLFKSDYSCKIIDQTDKKIKDIPVKNIKKAVAIANNPKRYSLLSKVLEIKDGAKLGDLLPLKNHPQADTVVFRNNSVRIVFMKEGNNARPVNYSRIPNDPTRRQEGKRISSECLDDMYDKTADGWYVVWALM